MKRKTTDVAFTLIEMLVVIAIIAVLGAILYPVFGRVREGAHQATCMSNMHELFVKANMYKDDHNGQYPQLLLGVAEQANGAPVVGNAVPVPADSMHSSPLYPAYVKSLELFHCPDNPASSKSQTATADFPATSGWTGHVVNGSGGITYSSLPAGAPLMFYAYDSYDVSSIVGGALNAKQLVYARDWTAATGQQDKTNQLKYRDPPQDRTILTYCFYHASVAGSNMCTVVSLSGQAKTMDARRLVQKGWDALTTN